MKFIIFALTATETTHYNDPNGGWLGVTEQRITDVYWNEEYILAKRCGLLTWEQYTWKRDSLGLEESNMRHINLF